ncbi:MAG: hypothetical protein EBS06_09605, partial [Proteobacteria bacterium]|nr:hypothetical protein [Pseudomonadota bacterium]
MIVGEFFKLGFSNSRIKEFGVTSIAEILGQVDEKKFDKIVQQKFEKLDATSFKTFSKTKINQKNVQPTTIQFRCRSRQSF